MNLQQFAPLAMRTAKIMREEDMIAHGAMGCCTEAGEVAETVCKLMATLTCDRENIREELGDGAWFGIYTACAVGVEPEGLDSVLARIQRTQSANGVVPVVAYLTLQYCAAAEKVGTLAKAHRYYDKPLDIEAMRTALSTFFMALDALAGALEFELSEILEANVAKLSKRYPDKYSDAAAIARADKEIDAEPSFIASQIIEPSEAAHASEPEGGAQ